MSVRESYSLHFGEDEALRIEEASLGHLEGVGPEHKEDKWGADPFQYHLLMCIGFDCFTPKLAKYHGITVPLEEARQWCLAYGNLAQFAGDIPDYLALMSGAYNDWIVIPD